MPTTDISNIFRLLPPFLQENPDLEAQVTTLAGMADGNGLPDAEDTQLSREEIDRFVQNSRIRSQRISQDLNVLRGGRALLLGSLDNVRQFLAGQGVSEQVQAQLETFAAKGGEPSHLSLSEMESWIQQLDAQAQTLARFDPATIESDAQRLMTSLAEIENRNPAFFFPESESARRAPISLEALRWLEPRDWEEILSLGAPRADEDPSRVDPRKNFYRQIMTLADLAGIDPQQPPAAWSLDFATVESRFAELPEELRQAYLNPERLMADLRYAAHQVTEEVNHYIGEKILANPTSSVYGLSVQPLIDNPLAANDPRAQLFIEQAGPDGVLTRLELGQSLLRYFPQEAPAQEDVLNQLQLLITASTPQSPVAEQEAPNFRREISRLVLDDLRRMQEGFTLRDREIAVEGGGMFGWGAPLIQGASWLVTLGGRTTGGNTYNDVMREAVEVGDTQRGRALASLRDLIERPSAEFQEWLRARGSDPHSGAIPEALEFLRATAPDHARRLDGPLFQAQRIWDIRNLGDAEEQAMNWLGFAYELRGISADPLNSRHYIHGYASPLGGGTAAFRLNNLDFARSIFHALRSESKIPRIQVTADYMYRRSLGYDILDSAGHLLQRGGGQLGISPNTWFRNYSDEAAATAIGDGVLLALSFQGSGGPLRGIKAIFSRAGRQGLMDGALGFVGLRSSSLAVAEQPLLATVSQGPNWLRRRLLAAEAEAGVATGRVRQVNQELEGLQIQLESAAGAETRSLEAQIERMQAALHTAKQAGVKAQAAVDLSRGVHRILTLPVVFGEGVARVYRGNRLLRWPLQGLGWVAGDGLLRAGMAGYGYERLTRNRPEVSLPADMEYRINLPESARPIPNQ